MPLVMLRIFHRPCTQVGWGLAMVCSCDLWSGPTSCCSPAVSSHDSWSGQTSCFSFPDPTLIWRLHDSPSPGGGGDCLVFNPSKPFREPGAPSSTSILSQHPKLSKQQVGSRERENAACLSVCLTHS